MKYALIPVLTQLNEWMEDNDLNQLTEDEFVRHCEEHPLLVDEALVALHIIYHTNNGDIPPC